MQVINGFLLGVLTAALVALLIWLIGRRIRFNRMVKVGYWVFVDLPHFEKSKQYRVMDATPTHVFVSSDGLAISGRWVPRSHIRPSTKADPYKKVE